MPTTRSQTRPSKAVESAAPVLKASQAQPTTGPIFFWKLHETPYGPFCQWSPHPITAPFLTFSIHSSQKKPYVTSLTTTKSDDGSSPIPTFNTAEQFMMAHKAHLFNPDDPLQRTVIMNTADPREQKALGRLVPNFDGDVWTAHAYDIVKWGNYYKFTQDETLRSLLLETGDRELVEASPRDKIWGVGFGANNAAKNRSKWGQNLLGKALMEVRSMIRNEMEDTEAK